MTTSSPTTLDQGKKVLDLFQGCTAQQVQNIVSNGDLIKMMLDAPLMEIDRAEFKALLNPASAPIAWRPVSGYAAKIAEWNELRGWGLTKTQIDKFASQLVDHAGPNQPTGITMWLGQNLVFNWEEAIACLQLEVEAIVEKFNPYFTSSEVKFYPGSEQGGKRKLAVALLNLQTYQDTSNGVIPNKVRKIEERLPGLEVAWLLALNPEVYVAIDYETILGFIAAGLVVDSGLVPYFGCDSDEAYVDAYWAGYRWHDAVAVAFRGSAQN